MPHPTHITEQSIQLVRDASIEQVVSHYVSLDRKGFACCPFHAEKSPSFKIEKRRNIYKCFGCGAGGDTIRFVMELQKLDFIQSCEAIANICGINLEYKQVEDPEKYEAAKQQRLSLMELVGRVVAIYRDNLWSLPTDHSVRQYLDSRKITAEEITEWQLGWATEDWKHLTSRLINDGQFQPAFELGIIKKAKDGESHYDGYRSRITIPITNHLGQYIGLGGRFHLIDPNDKDKGYPKYINSTDNELYNKSSVLFGLAQSAKGIKEKSCAILTEGYFDVISLHKNGDDNAVATCGTALTADQAKLLKRYTTSVLVLRDGDKAGLNAVVKDLTILVKQGFKVEVGILPDGEDPDSLVNKLAEPTPVRELVKIEDAILWRVRQLTEDAKDDITKLAEAKQVVLELLASIPNELIRMQYFDTIVKAHKWKRPEMLKRLDSMAEEEPENFELEADELADKLPEWMNREEFMNQGYCAVKNKNRFGYYSFGASGKVEITNFLITPLFHVFAGKDSRHLIQIDNGKKKAVLDVESKVMVSIDLMQQYLVAHGAFIFYGSKNHLLRIATYLLQKFPMCYEVKFLGWQQQSFFAWVNKAYVVESDKLVDYDNWGIIQHKENNHLIPAACEAYRELEKTGEDPFEPDRVLTWIKPRFSFSQWADLMNKVYKEKGPVGIAYVILSAFRDIIFEIDNNCPHLYGFGERSAGKSKWAESIGAVFFHNRSAFNLNSGTDYAFFDYMSRFRNTPALLNEFDEKVIKEEWFQSIKGIYDGESRQRGKIGQGRRGTEIMKVDSTLVLTGQYLCTMDDNSIVSRSLIEGFSERDITEQEKKWFNELKDAESEGITGLISEVLKYRPEFKSQYKELFNEFLSRWRNEIDANQVAFNQRIMQNWVHLYTCYHLMAKYIKLPVSAQSFYDYCKDKACHWSNFIRTSDTLSDFWNTLPFLLDQGLITAGWDFKVEVLTQVKLRNGKTKEEFVYEFPQPTRVLFIRLNNVHKYYEQTYRSRTGKTAMTLDNLNHYFGSRKYYLGNNKQKEFTRWVTKTQNETIKGNQYSQTRVEAVTRKELEKSYTSSSVFLYDPLNIDLDRMGEEEHQDEQSNLPF